MLKCLSDMRGKESPETAFGEEQRCIINSEECRRSSCEEASEKNKAIKIVFEE